MQFACLALGVACWFGCGYEPVRSASHPDLGVRAAPHAQPHLSAVQAALSGARSELGELGQLSDSSDYPALVVEVFHVQERSSGVRAEGPTAETPLARGSVLTLSGRAWITDRPGGPARGDTGPVVVSAPFASGADDALDEPRRNDALKRAARQLGRVLARKALGLPEGGSSAR